MQKHILIPVDFSENAWIAVRYADAIAAQYDYKIRLLHVYRPFRSGFQASSDNQADETDAREEAMRNMDSFLNRITKTTGAYPEYILEQGVLTEVIQEYCTTQKPIFIAMGTKGATGMKYVLMGSQTFAVARMAPVPLLIVPEDTLHFQMHRAGLLSDLRMEDQQSLQTFLQIFGNQAKIRLIHITGEDTDITALPVQISKHAEALGFMAGIPGAISASSAPAGSGIPGITAAEQLDMLILTIREKSFFERLINKSFSKAVIHNPAVPVLLIRVTDPE